MKGIRVKGKKELWPPFKGGYQIDYRFSDICHCIEDILDIDQLWWKVENVTFSSCQGFTEEQSELIDEALSEYVQVDDHSTWFCSPGFIRHLNHYIGSDWCDLAGASERDKLSELNLSKITSIKRNAIIYFSCIDGTYWEVYSKNEKILETIKEQFIHVEMIDLKDKKV